MPKEDSYKYDHLPPETALSTSARDFLRDVRDGKDFRGSLTEFCAQVGRRETGPTEAEWYEMRVRLSRSERQICDVLFSEAFD